MHHYPSSVQCYRPPLSFWGVTFTVVKSYSYASTHVHANTLGIRRIYIFLMYKLYYGYFLMTFSNVFSGES